MEMCSLEEMMVGKLFFSLSPLLPARPEAGHLTLDRAMLLRLDGKATLPMVVNLTSQTSGNSSGPLSGGGSLAISRISVTTQNDASTALGAIDSALAYVQAERSNLGSIQNRLTHTTDNLSNIVTSTSAAQSRIRDTDYAKETSELARTQIIQQAATAMLAQANQQPQLVLQLLQ